MPVCSNCKNEKRIEYKFCPNCGSQLWQSWDGAALAKLFGGVEIEAGKRVHKLAEYKLWRIGKELGFHSITEYPVPDLVQVGRTSLINVIWKSDKGIEFAFEIRTKDQELDIVTTRKDISKLQNLSARKKFVVNISKRTGKAYFSPITDEPKQVISQKVILDKSYDLGEIRKKDLRAYESWGPDEDQELSKYFKEGLSVSQLAKKHQRRTGAIRSRLKKLELVESQDTSKRSNIRENRLITFLVKSEKNGRICLAGVDEDKLWVRPIKPGGFEEKDAIMDNGKVLSIFDVVEMEFADHFPIKHQKENLLFNSESSIKFVMSLGEDTRKSLLSEIANAQILDNVSSREELFNVISTNLEQSLVLVGPIHYFQIQCNIISGKNHPRIWVVRKSDRQRVFSITCTDIKFCAFIKNKLENTEGNEAIINSQDIVELRNKETYFVIGLTGDSLDANNKIKDGRYAPPGSSIQPRYWPMIVSVLTVPNYSEGD
jgi:hypothetical protein